MRKELNFKLYRMTKAAQKLTVLNRLENLEGAWSMWQTYFSSSSTQTW